MFLKQKLAYIALGILLVLSWQVVSSLNRAPNRLRSNPHGIYAKATGKDGIDRLRQTQNQESWIS